MSKYSLLEIHFTAVQALKNNILKSAAINLLYLIRLVQDETLYETCQRIKLNAQHNRP